MELPVIFSIACTPEDPDAQENVEGAVFRNIELLNTTPLPEVVTRLAKILDPNYVSTCLYALTFDNGSRTFRKWSDVLQGRIFTLKKTTV